MHRGASTARLSHLSMRLPPGPCKRYHSRSTQLNSTFSSPPGRVSCTPGQGQCYHREGACSKGRGEACSIHQCAQALAYPTLKWYVGGRSRGLYRCPTCPQLPRHGRESLALLDWIRSQTLAVAVEVTSDPQAKDLIAGSKVASRCVSAPRWWCSACSLCLTPRGNRSSLRWVGHPCHLHPDQLPHRAGSEVWRAALPAGLGRQGQYLGASRLYGWGGRGLL